jgi:hypothetical protein
MQTITSSLEVSASYVRLRLTHKHLSILNVLAQTVQFKSRLRRTVERSYAAGGCLKFILWLVHLTRYIVGICYTALYVSKPKKQTSL